MNFLIYTLLQSCSLILPVNVGFLELINFGCIFHCLVTYLLEINCVLQIAV